MDLITGSNCCDSVCIFLFLGNRQGEFDRPWFFKVVLGDLPLNRYPGKIAGRPHLIDWNGDGHADLIFKTSVYVPYEDAESDGNPKYRQEDRLFVGLGPLDRANAVDLHDELQRRRAQQSSERPEFDWIDPLAQWLDARQGSQPRWKRSAGKVDAESWPIKYNWDGTLTSLQEDLTSVLWKLEPALVLPELPIPEELQVENAWWNPQYIAFGDYDGDGKFDLLMSVANQYHVEEDSKRRRRTNFSAIYVCRNIGTASQPQFAPPEMVFEAAAGTFVSTFNFASARPSTPELIAVIGLDDHPQERYEIRLLQTE